jgi:hypothetical protein
MATLKNPHRQLCAAFRNYTMNCVHIMGKKLFLWFKL